MPLCRAANSDSASLDNTAELLVRTGDGIDKALMMLVPEAYQNHPDLDTNYPHVKDFYRFAPGRPSHPPRTAAESRQIPGDVAGLVSLGFDTVLRPLLMLRAADATCMPPRQASLHLPAIVCNWVCCDFMDPRTVLLRCVRGRRAAACVRGAWPRSTSVDLMLVLSSAGTTRAARRAGMARRCLCSATAPRSARALTVTACGPHATGTRLTAPSTSPRRSAC